MSYGPFDDDGNDGLERSEERGDYVEFGGLRTNRLGTAGKSRRIAVGVGVAVVALLGGAGVAYAANGSPAASGQPVASPSASPTPSPSIKCPTNAPVCPRWGKGGPFRHFGFGGGAFGPGGPGGLGGVFGAVHGQIVEAKPGGGYETVDIQRGKVTSVSSTAITVKSADGFTATYVVAGSTIVDAQRDGIGSVKVGNQISLTAIVSGSKATATSITDLSLVQQSGPFGAGSGSVS